MTKNLIKSISYDNDEIINNILNLYCKDGIDLDCTYSKGVFYKSKKVKEPKFKSDILPLYDDVIEADCRNLPFENNSLSCIMFDPPFLATKGSSLKKDDNNNFINKRFSVFPTEKELFKFYDDSLNEFYRILRRDGVLIFKCQDKISSGKQYLSHIKIINSAERLGFIAEDLFILLAKSRIVAEWQIKNQKHARKFHSYFVVFIKK